MAFVSVLGYLEGKSNGVHRSWPEAQHDLGRSSKLVDRCRCLARTPPILDVSRGLPEIGRSWHQHHRQVLILAYSHRVSNKSVWHRKDSFRRCCELYRYWPLVVQPVHGSCDFYEWTNGTAPDQISHSR